MKQQTLAMVNRLKESGEDYEYYPTTDTMIQVIANDMAITGKSLGNNYNSILDIGAGDGSALIKIEAILAKESKSSSFHIEKYAIEMAQPLIQSMPPGIFIVGTDFRRQTLIDKPVNIIFCNPPYSEYAEWMLKIIMEANASLIYMIVPERWKNNQQITDMIKRRCMTETILYSTDFLDADRAARAKVDIVRLKTERHYKRLNADTTSDPFDLWFNASFRIQADNGDSRSEATERQQRISDELVPGVNLIERLETLYQNEFNGLLDNYRALEGLDAQLFKELNISVEGLKESLKLRIKGLKNAYWQELFGRLNAITSRLTKKSRDALLGTLTANTSVDFTIDNAYSVVIWAIKNCNLYLDKQLKDVYLEMSNVNNVKRYKSNKHFVSDGWRYQRLEATHYKLDYRLVFECHNCFKSDAWSMYDYPKGLYTGAHDLINDIITIGANLGFEVIERSYDFDWSPGKENIFTFKGANGAGGCIANEEFMRIRAYKNGNVHCKPNQHFIQKLNVEAGRLFGWLKDAKQAASELAIPVHVAVASFRSNWQIESKEAVKLIESR